MFLDTLNFFQPAKAPVFKDLEHMNSISDFGSRIFDRRQTTAEVPWNYIAGRVFGTFDLYMAEIHALSLSTELEGMFVVPKEAGSHLPNGEGFRLPAFAKWLC